MAMTEEEWVACEDPEQLLDLLGDRLTERKRRLFACACCRLIPGFMESEPDQRSIELTELDVDTESVEPDEFPAKEMWDIRWYRRHGRNAVARAVDSHRGVVWQSRRLWERSEDEQIRARRQGDREL